MQQKPFGQKCPNSIEEGSIFCPFLHNSKNGKDDLILNFDINNCKEEDCESIRTFHFQNGYNFNTNSKTILKFIKDFRSMDIGDIVYVEKRSYDQNEREGSLIKFKICSSPYYSEENGFKAYRRRVTKVGEAQMIDKNGNDSHLLISMQRRKYGIQDY